MASATAVQNLYWTGSIILLSAGGALLAISATLIHLVKMESMYIAFLPIFISDAFTVLNFLPRDFYHLVTQQMDRGGWCKFSAWWTISCCVALNTNAAALAYFTNELVNDRFSKEVAKKKVRNVTIFGWAVGIMLASIFLGTDKVGNFRGIYCCLERIDGPSIATPYFIITGIAFSVMIHYYRKAYTTVKNVHDLVSKSVYNQEAGGSSPKTPEHIRGLFFLSSYMVGTFYICWFLVVILAFSEAVGASYPIGWDVLAGWCLKLQPILDCVIVIRGATKLLSIQTQHISQHKGNNSGNTPRAKDTQHSANADVAKKFGANDRKASNVALPDSPRNANNSSDMAITNSGAELLPTMPGVAERSAQV